MTQGQQIIDAIFTGLKSITKDNGFNRTLKDIFKGYVDPEADMPKAYFILENADAVPNDESYTLGLFTQPVYIGIHYKSTSDSGTFTDEQEIILSDLSDWIIGSKGTGKSLDLSAVTGLQSFNISKVYRDIEWKDNIGKCGIAIIIRYEGNIG